MPIQFSVTVSHYIYISPKNFEKTCAGQPLPAFPIFGPRASTTLVARAQGGPWRGKTRQDRRRGRPEEISRVRSRAREQRGPMGARLGRAKRFPEVSKLTPAALWRSTELSMVGAQTSTGVGHPKKLVQRASRGLGKTFFTRKKPVKYAMDGLLASLGPLQTFCGASVLLRADPADPAEPPYSVMDIQTR